MISIITPILNEEGYMKPFLEHLGALEGNFEIILIDGGSKDRTLKEVEDLRLRTGRRFNLLEAPRGRAVQMNKGAQAACGDILLFLHADCFIQKDSLRLIEEEIYAKKNIGGGLTQSYYNPDSFLKFSSALGNIRVKFTKIFYGDYGIFLRKDIFEKIGRYDNIPFLEDVELCRKAKKYGRLVQIDRFIFTSSRRYWRKGRIRLTIVFSIAVILNSVGFRPGFFSRYIADK